MTQEEKFQAVVGNLRPTPGVTPPSPTSSTRRFGSNALKVNGKIFAMLTRGALVVRLPRSRVDELVASHDGDQYEPRPGRPMKEWLSLRGDSRLNWTVLAKEALDFTAHS